MLSNSELETNLNIFSTLIGKQKGNISGKDIIFLQKTYFQHQLQTNNTFYKEALLAMAKFDTKKGIERIDHWDREHIFYNPLFLKNNGKTLTLNRYCEDRQIYDFERLEKRKKLKKQETYILIKSSQIYSNKFILIQQYEKKTY